MTVVPGNAQAVGDRENQQDSFGFSDFADDAFARHGGVMMVLCDGMGGLANGAAASRVAVDTVLAAYHRKQPAEPIPSALERAVSEAQQAVCKLSKDGGSAGTTVVAAVVWNQRLYWASLGDSRLYLCRRGASATQLTEDHNIATEMTRRAARGEISMREANTALDAEALTGYLGSPRPLPPQVNGDGLPLQIGDRVVACSDGLYRALTPAAMAAAAHRGTAMEAAQGMLDAVLSQRLKYQDNVTVVVLEVAGDKTPLWKPETVAEGMIVGAAGGIAAAALLAAGLGTFGILRFSDAVPAATVSVHSLVAAPAVQPPPEPAVPPPPPAPAPRVEPAPPAPATNAAAAPPVLATEAPTPPKPPLSYMPQTGAGLPGGPAAPAGTKADNLPPPPPAPPANPPPQHPAGTGR